MAHARVDKIVGLAEPLSASNNPPTCSFYGTCSPDIPYCFYYVYNDCG